ncbi:MAG: TetR family transcriptional regulator [Rhizobiales bacterium]|nr:TetR family transcriptional regulator [Hyphomicrobiales bacterium]
MGYHHGNLRSDLLARAAEVIAAEGIEALSLRGLARDLGVSHAAPSRHFDDKAALLRALGTDGSEKLANYVLSAADEAGDNPLKRYAAMGKAYIRFSLVFPAYYKAMTHPEVCAQSDAAFSASAERRRQIISDAARAAQAAGWLADEALEDVLMFSIGTVRGVSAMLADPMHHSQTASIETDLLIENIVRLIIDPDNPQRRLKPAPQKSDNQKRVSA